MTGTRSHPSRYPTRQAVERERRLTMERWERFEETGEFVDGESVAAWMDGLMAGENPRCPVADHLPKKL